MFATPEYVFKSGELVVKNGKVVKVVQGATHVVRPDYDKSIEKPLKDYFDRYLTVRMENFKLADEEIIRGDKGSIVVQPTGARAAYASVWRLGRAAENVEIGFLEMIFLHDAGGLRQRALAGLMRGLLFRLLDRAAVRHLVGRVVANLQILGACGLGGHGKGQDEQAEQGQIPGDHRGLSGFGDTCGII